MAFRRARILEGGDRLRITTGVVGDVGEKRRPEGEAHVVIGWDQRRERLSFVTACVGEPALSLCEDGAAAGDREAGERATNEAGTTRKLVDLPTDGAEIAALQQGVHLP